MILIADSGSTKTHWVVVATEKQTDFYTKGLNPYFVDENEIYNVLKAEINNLASAISHVFFYGAGCSQPDKIDIVKKGIGKVCTNANIDVYHDILASAVATCGHEKGIACILGTGSNACFFDGKTIRSDVPSLGYLLGDEGSGSYFGKRLCHDFFYKNMPTPISQIFDKKYNLTLDNFLHKIYKEASPNTYLAGFSQFLSEQKYDAYIIKIIQEGFDEFFKQFVIKYPEHTHNPVHFVGSLAFHFKEELQTIALKNNCILGNVLQEPIYALVNFHKSTLSA